jgi:predicted MPP superfamily phosphohydrolase
MAEHSFRPICWLHISDIHMRVTTTWSQDVVLKAMCDDIERRRKDGISADFILVTGDLAFSGQADEYKLVASFFDALVSASGVHKDRIFCIPGNHDIDRERHKMCFLGCRHFAQTQNKIDELLALRDDLETLLKRQEHYKKFQSSYLNGQSREWTEDGLAYVSSLTIEDLDIAIIGYDSAWLAEGGMSDNGKLLIGERQVINGIQLTAKVKAPIVIGMAHHPSHLLHDFDRRSVQRRVQASCHFFHCGHLHEPETMTAGLQASGCVTLFAGAAFETRQSQNTYSIITLDLLQGKRTVKTIQYRPASGAFAFSSSEEFPIEITPYGTCGVGELAKAMAAYHQPLSPFSHYLSALLLDQKTELPIPGKNSYVFGSYAVLADQPNSELKGKTKQFVAFKNVLRVFYNRISLAEIFARYGDAVANYAAALEEACKAHQQLKDRLAELEKDARDIAATTDTTSAFSYTVSLLDELAEAHEWVLLRVQAARHLNSTDPTLALHAKRLIALSLAHSTEASDKASAVAHYQSLIHEPTSRLTDNGNLANLLLEMERFDEAKSVILEGIEKFPPSAREYFSPIGLRIAEATGDRTFRQQLHAAIEARGKRG